MQGGDFEVFLSVETGKNGGRIRKKDGKMIKNYFVI